MTPPKRILCGCGCDAPEKPFQLTWRSAIGLGLIVGALTAMFTGCTPSDAKPPQHVLEIGDPPVVVKRFELVSTCEQFRDDLIVALTLGGETVPKPMRCQ